MGRVATPVEVALRRLQAVDHKRNIRSVADEQLIPVERGIGLDPQPVASDGNRPAKSKSACLGRPAGHPYLR